MSHSVLVTELRINFECCIVSPVFVTAPFNQTVIVPFTVKWRCVVAANPTASITWRKDGNRLGTRGNVVIVTSDDGSELVLTNVSRRDAGAYVCRARNNVGRSTVSATLEVHGELTCLAVFHS